MKLIGRWVNNIRSCHLEPSTQASCWRVFMENKVVGIQWPCGGKTSPLLEQRSLLVGFILLNTLPLFMSSTTYHIFQPELKWSCFEEIHMGTTSLCQNYDKVETDRKRVVCAMEYDLDYIWNFTFTNSPLIEFKAYCPLERSVEPKLVNFLGTFAGSLIGGIFIDTLGRRNMALITTFFSIICTFSYYICDNIIMYTYQEFIKGLFTSAASMAFLTWSVELSQADYSSLTVAVYLVVTAVGQGLTIGLTYWLQSWKMINIIISGIGVGFFPLLFLVPLSMRFVIAKGVTGREKKLRLPSNIEFENSDAQPARAKDCITKPYTNRLYATNAFLVILLGFSTHLLMDIISTKYYDSSIFSRQAIQTILVFAGYIIALVVTIAPMLMYIISVFFILMAAILSLVATSSNYSDSHWSLSRVFTGSSLMLVSMAVSVVFTTMKQIPTLNRAFYISSLNAAFMLGQLLFIIVQSYCLERGNRYKVFCSEDSEDTKLLTAGIVLLIAVAFSFLNTCLSKNITLPHSYEELKELYERSQADEAEGTVRRDGPVPTNDNTTTSL